MDHPIKLQRRSRIFASSRRALNRKLTDSAIANPPHDLRHEAIGVEGRRASVRRIPKMNVREGHANREIAGSSAQSHGGWLGVVGVGGALVWW
jgi:hypothetical protein